MKLRSNFLVLMVFGLVALFAGRAKASTTPVSALEQGALVLDQALNVPLNGIPDSVLKQALAVAVFPNANRTSVLNGAQMTEGTMVARKADGTWSNPAFVYLREATPGSVPGGLAKNFILVIEGKEIFDTLLATPVGMEANSIVAGGPLENSMGEITSLPVPIYSYTLEGGRLLGIAPLGAFLQFDTAANSEFYGASGITPAEIFASKRIMAPIGAARLKCTLAMHTNTKQAKQVCG